MRLMITGLTDTKTAAFIQVLEGALIVAQNFGAPLFSYDFRLRAHEENLVYACPVFVASTQRSTCIRCFQTRQTANVKPFAVATRKVSPSQRSGKEVTISLTSWSNFVRNEGGVANDTSIMLFYSELLILLGGSDRQTVHVALDEVAVLASPAVLLSTHKHRHAFNTRAFHCYRRRQYSQTFVV